MHLVVPGLVAEMVAITAAVLASPDGTSSGPGCSTATTWTFRTARRSFATPAAMGREGIVSKRADSRYKSGRCFSWVKVKNPEYERR